MQTFKPCTFAGIVYATVLATACSGGGGSEGSTDPDTNAPSGLSGTIFVSNGQRSINTGEIWAIDAATRTAELYVRPLDDDSSNFYDSPEFRPPTNLTNGELLIGSNDCLNLGLFAENYCIDIVGENGVVDRVVGRTQYLTNRPALSPDGSLVAYVTQASNDSSPFFLTLRRSDGSLVEEAEFNQPDNGTNFSKGIPSSAIALRASAGPHAIAVGDRLESDDMRFIRIRCPGACRNEELTHQFMRSAGWNNWLVE